MRKFIEDTWEADVFIGYGTTEIGLLMAGECEKKDGMHLSETDFFTEVIDPKTGEQVEEGDVGELVFTTYGREGMPLIRYRSHDLGRIIPDLCTCGLPLRRIKIKGRTDDMIPIGAGDNLFTRMFDDAIFSISEVVDYQIVFDRKYGKDNITIIAETESIKAELRKKIFEMIMKLPEIKQGVSTSKTINKPTVMLVKPNTLDRKSIKARRLIDKRNLYD
jgi:phenylacetate-CoA ligase